jgi:hypothetical protein
MIDLSKIDESTLLARGSYSTVRAAHEDRKKELSVLCGKLQTIAAQILRKLQPDNDDVPESVADLLCSAREAVSNIETRVELIESLAKQRAELKKKAWS